MKPSNSLAFSWFFGNESINLKKVSKEYGHSESESRVRHYYCLKFFRIIASRELIHCTATEQ